MNKICVKCDIEKGIDEFYKRSAAKDGLDSYCKFCRNEISRSYYAETRSQQLERMGIYQAENAESIREYRIANKEYFNEYQKNYKRGKYNSDPLFKLKCNIRRSTSEILRGKKSQNTLDILGCSFEYLIAHLESQFQSGMTWDNYGKWHIDHKYPISLAKSTEELEKLCHYSNLQPLWAIDNIRKSNKIILQGNL